MADIKSAYATDMITRTKILLERIMPSYMDVSDAYMFLLGVTENDLITCFTKIINALPDSFFLQNNEISAEMQESIVREFIQFLAQEDILKEPFEQNFSNFILTMPYDVAYEHNILE